MHVGRGGVRQGGAAVAFVLLGSIAGCGSAPGTAAWQIKELSPLTGGTQSRAYAANSSGEAVGTSDVPARASFFHAVLFKDTTVTDLGTLRSDNGGNSDVYTMNDSGDAVGQSDVDSGDAHAVWFHNGQKTDMGTLGGKLSHAFGINAYGQIVGWSYTANNEVHPFVYVNGKMTDLDPNQPIVGNPGMVAMSHSTRAITRHEDANYSEAHMINDNGKIIGRTPSLVNGTVNFQAATWSNGQKTIIGTLRNDGLGDSRAHYLNIYGDVVGGADTPTGDYHAFYYHNGQMTDLGTLGGNKSEAHCINNAGQITGYAYTAGGVSHAFLYQNGKMTDLNSYLPAGSGWELTDGTNITSEGRIVGYGTLNGQTRAYVLTPPTRK